ncbi:HAD family hydrolase [Corynebacterium phoceense]
MDGTLTDSEPLWEKATYRMAALLGRELTPEVRERTVGASFPNTFRICCEWAGFTPAHGDYERYRDDSFKYVASLYQSEDTVFPGVRALLSELQADGVPMFVTTNTERAVAIDVVESIGRSYFVDVICGDDVPVGKPDPACTSRQHAALAPLPRTVSCSRIPRRACVLPSTRGAARSACRSMTRSLCQRRPCLSQRSAGTTRALVTSTEWRRRISTAGLRSCPRHSFW